MCTLQILRFFKALGLQAGPLSYGFSLGRTQIDAESQVAWDPHFPVSFQKIHCMYQLLPFVQVLASSMCRIGECAGNRGDCGGGAVGPLAGGGQLWGERFGVAQGSFIL